MKQKHLHLRRTIFFLCTLLGTLSVHAYDAKIDGIYYNLDSSTMTATVTYIYGYNSYVGSVNIPEHVIDTTGTTYKVTAIDNEAFRGCSSLTSVTIPNSITFIGSYAFKGCSGLTSLTIPNSVTDIGTETFYGCSGLTSVTIPNSVTKIYDKAFYGCSGFTSVTIPNSITCIGEDAFYGCI